MSEDDQQNLALRYHRFGPPRDVLTLEPAPLDPRPSQSLRVQMLLAPINPSDLIPITGAYSHLIKPPMTAGYEGVGRVIAAPSEWARLVGQRVLPLRGPGTWQHELDCDPGIAVPVPDDVPDDLAARAYINPLSALLMLRLWPVTGRHMVITGAGSGIAALLAQWGHADGAARISGIYRSPARREWLKAMGVLPIAQDDAAGVQACARDADVVFDAVGGPLGSAMLGAMRQGAEFVSYGLLSGQPVWAPTGAVAAHRRFHLREKLRDMDLAAWQDSFVALWPRLLAARMHGPQVFPVADWRAALDAFDQPGRAEKPLLGFA